MKRIGVRFGVISAAAAVLAASIATPALAADAEFKNLVSGIEQRYQVRHEHIPLIGLISFCSWVYTRGGVRGFRFADFEDTGSRISADDIDALVQVKLGASWTVILRSHEKETHEDTIIYVRPNGDKFLVLIADVENGELSLVKLSLNGNKLSKWVNDQERHEKKSQGPI